MLPVHLDLGVREGRIDGCVDVATTIEKAIQSRTRGLKQRGGKGETY